GHVRRAVPQEGGRLAAPRRNGRTAPGAGVLGARLPAGARREREVAVPGGAGLLAKVERRGAPEAAARARRGAVPGGGVGPVAHRRRRAGGAAGRGGALPADAAARRGHAAGGGGAGGWGRMTTEPFRRERSERWQSSARSARGETITSPP